MLNGSIYYVLCLHILCFYLLQQCHIFFSQDLHSHTFFLLSRFGLTLWSVFRHSNRKLTHMDWSILVHKCKGHHMWWITNIKHVTRAFVAIDPVFEIIHILFWKRNRRPSHSSFFMTTRGCYFNVMYFVVITNCCGGIGIFENITEVDRMLLFSSSWCLVLNRL